jgi:hypothetical protein
VTTGHLIIEVGTGCTINPASHVGLVEVTFRNFTGGPLSLEVRQGEPYAALSGEIAVGAVMQGTITLPFRGRYDVICSSGGRTTFVVQ